MKKILTACFLGTLLLLCTTSLKTAAQANNSWKLWIKTSPCAGRFDWISVAKENPGIGGLGAYQLASTIFPNTACTNNGCSFKEATRQANSLRISPSFSNYCCRDYSVWKNARSGNKTIVKGIGNNAGPGWILEKANLCCEEAEQMAGLPGALQRWG